MDSGKTRVLDPVKTGTEPDRVFPSGLSWTEYGDDLSLSQKMSIFQIEI